MAAYEYIALTAAGKRRKGVLEGDSARQIRQMLREQGLVPMDVNETVQKTRAKSQRKPLFQRGISVTDMSLLMRQIATLVQSGMPVEESLSAVAQQTDKGHVKSLILAMRSKVLEGHSLASGMAEYPHVFSELYRATTDAGEHSGHLDVVLERLADYAEIRQQMRQKSLLALFYPLILSLVALGAVIGLMTFVVPKVVATFERQAADLPLLTELLIATSDGIREHGMLMLGLILAAAFVGRITFARPGPKHRLHQILLRLPLIGRLNRGFNTARFARTFSILAASGVPVLDAMRVSRQVVSNLPMREAVDDAIGRVREGQAIHKALSASGYFPPMMLHLIANGEASGELDNMLERAAVNQEREMDTTVSALMGVLEPALILTMGGFVLMIVMAILLPIFNLNNLVQ